MRAQAMQREKGASWRLFSWQFFSWHLLPWRLFPVSLLFARRFWLATAAVFCVLAAGAAHAEQAADCRAQRPLQEAQVEWIADGDTVKLSDGRFVRILGLNAPETARKDRAGQPLAETARMFLTDALGSGLRVWLEEDEELEDRYQRRLAHLFDGEGRNLAAALLHEGLAAALIMPPNLRHADCYRDAQSAARREQRGIWNEPYYQPFSSRALDRGLGGFRRVEGRVVRMNRTRNSLWIELEGDRISLRIANTELPMFEKAMGKLSGERWLGRTLTGQGYLTTQKDGKYRGRYRMRIYHPAALQW